MGSFFLQLALYINQIRHVNLIRLTGEPMLNGAKYPPKTAHYHTFTFPGIHPFLSDIPSLLNKIHGDILF